MLIYHHYKYFSRKKINKKEKNNSETKQFNKIQLNFEGSVLNID